MERAGALIHLVDATQDDVVGAWRTVRGELEAYGEGLADRPEILALNKVDSINPEERAAKAKALKKASGAAPRLISGVSGEGVQDLLRAAFKAIRLHRAGEVAETSTLDASSGWSPV